MPARLPIRSAPRKFQLQASTQMRSTRWLCPIVRGADVKPQVRRVPLRSPLPNKTEAPSTVTTEPLQRPSDPAGQIPYPHRFPSDDKPQPVSATCQDLVFVPC